MFNANQVFHKIKICSKFCDGSRIKAYEANMALINHVQYFQSNSIDRVI